VELKNFYNQIVKLFTGTSVTMF